MKILRTLFVLWLCAALPLTGLAASGSAGQCPMQSMTADSGNMMSESMPGCESMATIPGQDSKSKDSLCKMTVQCQMGCMTIPVFAPGVARTAGAYRPMFFHYTQSLFVREPDGLWKPPRAL
ncbi:MAG: hypothetical protein QOF74_1932 [Caballeronia mineralivorans]|nr:hypothetical protein [Caballeronia mineralivorans]